jgi:phenylpropionate dioxygenase-like ring-hydroxylating dioxygenase large terminal subunit
MFINFWYAAEWSDKLKEQPLKLKMLGQNVVLFRDAQGEAHCLANTCPHRGGSLSNGMVVDGDLECPYHGWRYGGDGRCTRLTSLGRSAKPPPRAKVDSYPVQEKYGLIFVFLGDLPEEQRPGIMEVTQWGDPEYRWTRLDNTFNANYSLAMENGVDTGHTEFVHSHIAGFRGADRPDGEYKAPVGEIVDVGEWGGAVGAYYPPSPGWGTFLNKILGFDKIFTGGYVNTAYWGPNGLDTSIYLSKKLNIQIPQYLWETPIDEFTTKVFLLGGRNFFMTPLFDYFDRARNMKFSRQDAEILENIEPGLPPESPSEVLFVEPDNIIGHQEKSRKKWEAMGWRIDLGKMREYPPGKKQFVIPSPGRRESGQWVYDAVPLIPAKPTAVTPSVQAS